MNISHPYGYPIAFALVCAGLFFLVQTVIALDDLREKRSQRRLDQDARTEEIRQRLQAAADRMNTDQP